MESIVKYGSKNLKENSVVLAETFFESYREADQLVDWLQSFSLVRMICQLFYKAYLYLIVLPFFHIYIHGPNIGPIGFWSGMTFHQICAKITNMNDPDFWNLTEENSKRCQILILQHFHSFWILGIGIIYFLLLSIILKLGIRWVLHLARSLWKNPAKPPQTKVFD